MTQGSTCRTSACFPASTSVPRNQTDQCNSYREALARSAILGRGHCCDMYKCNMFCLNRRANALPSFDVLAKHVVLRNYLTGLQFYGDVYRETDKDAMLPSRRLRGAFPTVKASEQNCMPWHGNATPDYFFRTDPSCFSLLSCGSPRRNNIKSSANLFSVTSTDSGQPFRFLLLVNLKWRLPMSLPKDTSPTVMLRIRTRRSIQRNPTSRQNADLPHVAPLRLCHTIDSFWAIRRNSHLRQIETRFRSPCKWHTTFGASASWPASSRRLLTTPLRRNRTSAGPEADNFPIIRDTDNSRSGPFFFDLDP